MVAVRVLGCSGSYAAPGGACTGYLIESPGARVWLDCGPGTLANLQQWCSLSDLDAVVLTHAHPDHWLELPVVASALEWYERRPPLPVWSNSHMFGEAREVIGQVITDVFEWHVVAHGDRFVIGDQQWGVASTEHYVPTLATRIDADGSSLLFGSDTGPGFEIEALLSDDAPLDLVMLESTFLERRGNEGVLHLSAGEAAELASRSGASRLLLTHQAPNEDRQAHLETAAQGFGGPVALAEVGELYAAAE